MLDVLSSSDSSFLRFSACPQFFVYFSPLIGQVFISAWRSATFCPRRRFAHDTKFLGLILSISSFRRFLSSVLAIFGNRHTFRKWGDDQKRPGMVISQLSLGPLVEMGSFNTCTKTLVFLGKRPRFCRSSCCRAPVRNYPDRVNCDFYSSPGW